MTDKPITRRRALAGAAGLAGVAALAGCTREEQQERAQVVVQALGEAPPTRPSSDPGNEYWDYLLRSAEYQNQQMQAQSEGIVALLDDAGIQAQEDS